MLIGFGRYEVRGLQPALICSVHSLQFLVKLKKKKINQQNKINFESEKFSFYLLSFPFSYFYEAFKMLSQSLRDTRCFPSNFCGGN